MKTILAVDDSKVNLSILIELLGDDYDILVTLNGKEALEIVETQEIDVILLDVMMPEMDGYEVCEKLKANKKTKNIPVIFITALTKEDDIEKAYQAGGIDYVSKPFKPRELLSRIKTQINLKNYQLKEVENNKNRALTELIGNIAHQWRQPLSVISTLASGLSAQQSLGLLNENDIPKTCDEIVKKTEYLSSIINGFKSFSSNSEAHTSFNLSSLIAENYNLMFGDNTENNIEIHININKDIELTTIKPQLLQVLLPIINNAKDFLEEQQLESKFIFMKAYIVNKYAVIDIYDNAKGIENNIKDKIFEPYFTTRHQSEGKGLSLYFVDNIIRHSLKGTIKAFNIDYEYDNKKYTGANFRIALPIKI